MNNRDKQYLAGLEHRIAKAEHVLEAIYMGLQNASSFEMHCNKCHIVPFEGLVCGMPDCCQGLNPDDDKTKDTIKTEV